MKSSSTSETKIIRVLIADDHPVVREGLVTILKSEKAFHYDDADVWAIKKSFPLILSYIGLGSGAAAGFLVRIWGDLLPLRRGDSIQPRVEWH